MTCSCDVDYSDSDSDDEDDSTNIQTIILSLFSDSTFGVIQCYKLVFSPQASNIGFFEAYGFGYDFLNEYTKMVDEVTASDIVKVANKYFTSNVVQSDVR